MTGRRLVFAPLVIAIVALCGCGSGSGVASQGNALSETAVADFRYNDEQPSFVWEASKGQPTRFEIWQCDPGGCGYNIFISCSESICDLPVDKDGRRAPGSYRVKTEMDGPRRRIRLEVCFVPESYVQVVTYQIRTSYAGKVGPWINATFDRTFHSPGYCRVSSGT